MVSRKKDQTGLSPAELAEYADADSYGGAEHGGGAIFDDDPVTIRDVVSSRRVVGDTPGLGERLWGPQADRVFR